MQAPKVCVGVVCVNFDKVLLIRRGREPRKGHWSIPGGKVEWGEGLRAAALRELKEETGCDAELGPLIDVYEIIEPGYHYALIDYLAQWTNGEPEAADDADEARFVGFEEALLLLTDEDLKDVVRKAKYIINSK